MKAQTKKIPGIRAKLSGLILSFTALLLAAIWLLFVVLLDDFYKQAISNDLKRTVKDVEALLSLDEKTVISGINDIAASTGTNMALIKKDLYGREEYCILSAAQRNILSNRISVDGIIKRLEADGGEMIYILGSDAPPEIKKRVGIADQTMLYAKTVLRRDGSAVIMICVPLASVDATRSTIAQILITVSVIFVVAAFIISRVLSDNLAIPLEKLNVSAKDVGTPKYSKMQENPGCRETAELNETLARASEELEKVDGLRRELIANVSHDLRTPLTLISGYGEMMRDIPGENTKENIQIIIDEAEHLNLLVNDVLALSKLENGMDRLELSEFNLTAELKALINRYSALRAAEGYTLDFIYDREYTVVADEVKLSQVFYNLINNAITYTGSSARVQIKQSETEHGGRPFLRFDVIDDGDGIMPDNIPYIWDRYYKEKRAHKRAGVGSGLGLSIVKRVIELHGGLYGVISEVNKGSDFYVEIPLDLKCGEDAPG